MEPLQHYSLGEGMDHRVPANKWPSHFPSSQTGFATGVMKVDFLRPNGVFRVFRGVPFSRFGLVCKYMHGVALRRCWDADWQLAVTIAR